MGQPLALGGVSSKGYMSFNSTAAYHHFSGFFVTTFGMLVLLPSLLYPPCNLPKPFV